VECFIRDIALKKKLLVLAPRPIFPVFGGDALRIYNICKYLSDYFTITVLCFGDSDTTEKPGFIEELVVIRHSKFEALLQMFFGMFLLRPFQVSFYKSFRFRKELEERKGQFDLFLGHLIRTAPYLSKDCDRSVIEVTDYLPLTYSRMSVDKNFFLRFFYFIERHLVMRFHARNLDRFRSLSVVANLDGDLLRLETPENVNIYGNGCSIYRGAHRRSEKKIIFLGNLRSKQNQDAVGYFISEVFPIIRRLHFDAEFFVVGFVPKHFRSFWKRAGVHFVGVLDKLNEMPRGVGVCPIRIGAGVQNKVLDYVNYGMPVVSTPEGLEGLDFVEGQEVFSVRSAEEMAKKTAELLGDKKKCLEISTLAKKRLKEEYDWANKLSGYEEQFL
jgi:glycosyltransferase involved in cell wall biosynthesis